MPTTEFNIGDNVLIRNRAGSYMRDQRGRYYEFTISEINTARGETRFRLATYNNEARRNYCRGSYLASSLYAYPKPAQ